MPPDLSLNKRHFKNFIRRLRRQFPDQKIRYFHCGEYSPENLRPHYHACLFNCSFADQALWKTKDGINTYTSATLTELWPHGFSTVGELNYKTAAYTASYILSKVTGNQADDYYLRSDEDGVAYWVLPPYVTMSLKPGIGHDFYTLYHSDFFPSDESPVPGKGIINKVPRYYEKLLESKNPELLKLVKNLREQFIAAHGADFTPERLQDKYQCAKARLIQRTQL